ncbi:transposase, MuDR, MULE transposase domain protein [Tanacetum coccineum]
MLTTWPSFGDCRVIYAWALEVEGGYVLSCKLLFTIPHPADNHLKLLKFSKDKEPIVEAMIVQQCLSTLLFLKIPENSFEVLKLLENSVEVLKLLVNKLESMKILENKLEPLKLQENQPVYGLRGSIMHDDLTYPMLHDMLMKKFNLEANYPLNLSAKLSSFEDTFDITDDTEVQFFVECACNSKDELAHLYVSQHKTIDNTTSFVENNTKNMFYNFFDPTTFEDVGPSKFINSGLSLNFGPSDFHKHESSQKNESQIEKPECSFAFRDYNEYKNEQNAVNDVVDENPEPNYHKWEKFMSFEPDIPETPLYKSKPIISKHYKKETDVKVGNIFDNKEALDLAIRLKAVEDGYQFLTDRSSPERYSVKCFHFNECDWKMRATRWGSTDKFTINFLNDEHTCPKTQTYPNHQNANKKLIAHLLTLKLQDNKRVLKGKDTQHDILTKKRRDGHTYKNKRPRSIRDVIHCHWCVALYVCELFTAVAYNRCGTLKRSIQGNKSGGCGHGWKQPDCSNCFWYMKGGNRHPSIALAVQNEFPLAFYDVCCRHLMMNLSLKNRKTKGLFWKICKAHTPEELSSRMNNLQAIQPDSIPKALKLPVVLKLAETYRGNGGKTVHIMTFKVLLHHYGRITSPPGRKFIGEMVATVDPVELDNFSTNQVKFILINSLGYDENSSIFLYLKKPNCSLDSGLVSLADAIKDRDILLTKIPRRFTTLYYMLPQNSTLSGMKAIKNDYDTNVMYDIAKVARKLQLFVSHYQIDLSTVLIPNDGSLEESFTGVDFIIVKYIYLNASLSEMMNHVITNYTSESEDDKREVTQNDYTFDQMVEWAEEEHFEDEEIKELQRQQLKNHMY